MIDTIYRARQHLRDDPDIEKYVTKIDSTPQPGIRQIHKEIMERRSLR